jgi:dipeptide/tripeptide permease
VTVARGKLWRLSETICLAFAIASFVILLGLHYYFIGHRNNFPDPAIQAIYPLNEHGRIVYLTWQEFMMLKVLFWGAVVTFLLSVTIEVRINPFRRNYPFIRPGRE